MIKSLISVLAIIAIAGGGALASVLANGRVSHGYYWQKVERADRSIYYVCRSATSGVIERKWICRDAGAIKP